ncbi:MAG: ATP-binding protein, partial [Betaproteobacteria bacterium]
DWSHLAAPVHTLADLHELEVRCRHRESLGRLAGGPPGAVNAGVRALFKGPSGTGKTLAARLLANALGKDIYRIDLAAVVNKYIGETEKNLERAFSRAEELDVMLLLDEGDALLAQRTDVDSSNDRYANLETNYLLQRVESFGGILLVTTNAGDRIDGAFARRMDVVVDFPLPQPDERLAIWSLHLPAAHAVDDGLLWDVAQRCALSGGQIRNAALHATLLALDRDSPLGDEDLLAAIRREYRKAGGVCPLRQDS